MAKVVYVPSVRCAIKKTKFGFDSVKDLQSYRVQSSRNKYNPHGLPKLANTGSQCIVPWNVTLTARDPVIGTLIHWVEISGWGNVVIQAARTYRKIMRDEPDHAIANKLSFLQTCMGTVERLTNLLHDQTSFGDDTKNELSKESHNTEYTMEDKIDQVIKTLHEIREQREIYKNEITEILGMEIRMLKAELSGRLFLLEAENMELKKTNQEILARQKMKEQQLDECDKQLRLCNGYLKGLVVEQDDCMRIVNNFFAKKFNIPNAVVEAKVVNQNQIAIKFESLKSKREIFKRRIAKLAGLKIYLEHDLTEKEQRIAYRARQFVRETRAEGGRAAVSRNQVFINGERRLWNEKVQDFVSIEFFRYDIAKHIQW